jgi:uncharacterized protein YegP (UPF0339 family)
MAGKFEIYKNMKGEWRFRLNARNGEIVATGEAYPTKAHVKRGIASMQKAAEGAEIVDLSEKDK